MDIDALKKQWEKYLNEMDWTEEMNRHMYMANKVGNLIWEIESLNNTVKLKDNVILALERQLKDKKR